MRLTLLSLLLPAFASADNLDHGLHSLQAGDYALAEMELKLAVAERPADGLARFYHAAALRQEGLHEAALAEYRRALGETRDPALRANSLYGIAITRNEMGNAEEAAQAWREYVTWAEDHHANQHALTVARENLAAAEKVAAATPRVVTSQELAPPSKP